MRFWFRRRLNAFDAAYYGLAIALVNGLGGGWAWLPAISLIVFGAAVSRAGEDKLAEADK